MPAKGLIHMDEAKGEVLIKYQAAAAKIVRKLQKTSYVYEARDFQPPYH